jgi:hypothetical protein
VETCREFRSTRETVIAETPAAVATAWRLDVEVERAMACQMAAGFG